MARIVLGATAKTEIIESVRQCRTAAERSAVVDRLSEFYRVSRSRVYEISRCVRPPRRTRSDRGRRVADLQSHPALRLAAGLVLEYGINPAEAILMMRGRGEQIPVEFPTLNRYLRESGLGLRARRNPVEPHRRFEASAPGEIFQFDISGLKTRWLDSRTRRIINVSSLDVSKNHPNEKPDRIPVWRFALIDDFSRRVYLRYYAVQKPNSSHVVDFLLRGYSELGVPLCLYTDNDKIIKYRRTQRTTEILNKILADQGGYRSLFHVPGNARATGKVERIHPRIENFEKFIGVYQAERGPMTLDVLNSVFAPLVMQRIDNSNHSETGQKPLARWQSVLSVVRRLDYDSLSSAFRADEFQVRLRGDLTFRFAKKTYRLPGSDLYPFVNWIGQRLTIVFPDDQPFFTVVGLDGNEYDIDKSLASADVAGEFKSHRETEASRLRRDLRALAREHAKSNRGSAAPIPFFDAEVHAAELPAPSNVALMPKPEIVISPESVAAAAPGRPVIEHNPGINFWDAVGRFAGQFPSRVDCKNFMDGIFSSREAEAWLLLSEVKSAVADHLAQSTAPVALRRVG